MDGQMNMAVQQECTKTTVDCRIANARAIFLRKIKPTIDHEGETA
jgi:hypothetical protein